MGVGREDGGKEKGERGKRKVEEKRGQIELVKLGVMRG